MEHTYTVSELKQLVRESNGDFKPKFGNGVEADNKKNNKEAVNAMMKDANKNNKDSQKKTKYVKPDFNGTTIDYDVMSNVDEKKKKDIKAQAEGYTSDAEKNNGIEKSGEFNKEIYPAFKKSKEEKDADKLQLKKSGLAARTFPETQFEKPNMYENVRTVRFKKTEFLDEEYMKKRIPDELKCEGTKFHMIDKNDNDYLVEWNYGYATILEHNNPKKIDESLNRMKELLGYNTKTTTIQSTTQSRLNENREVFDDTLYKARKINEEIEEVDEFIPTGYRTISNIGGREIEISKDNSCARFKDISDKETEPTDWFEIEFDEEGNPFVNADFGREELGGYMKY